MVNPQEEAIELQVMPNREALHIKQPQITITQQKIEVDRQIPPQEQILRNQSQTTFLNAPSIKSNKHFAHGII